MLDYDDSLIDDILIVSLSGSSIISISKGISEVYMHNTKFNSYGKSRST